MLDQKRFMQKLSELAEYAELNGNVLTGSEVEQSLSELALSEEQSEMVYRYLAEKKIRIKRIVDVQDENVLPGNEEESVAEEADSRYLKMYMEELEELPKVTQSERLAMAIRLLAGEEEAYLDLLNASLFEVTEIANEYKGRGVSLEDLIQEGNIGLMQVLKELNGKGKQEEPLTYIREYVKYTLASYLDEQTMQGEDEDRVVAKYALLHEAAKYLGEENGVLPTAKELSEYTKIPEDEIEELVKLVKDVDFLGGEK